MSHRTRRTLARLVVVAAAALALLGTQSAQAAGPTASRPVWLPVHTAFGLDCAGNNPGCTARRDFFSIDVIPSGQYGRKGRPSHARVFAMGGGTVHIGDAHGSRCGAGHSFGTWLYISHGHQVFSRYGHLSTILVHNGEHVAAGAPIGVVGTTGKGTNCSVNYVDFEIMRGGRSDSDTQRIGTLQACTPKGRVQVWPAQAHTTKAFGSNRRVHYKTWGTTPHGTQFPASSGRCVS